MKRPYRLIDLFCGAGGMTLGFINSSKQFDCLLAVDNDPACVKTHTINFKSHTILANIEEWIEAAPSIPIADVVIGGPPCQGFSLLNKKRTTDERRNLWEPFLQVVDRSKAKVFVMENVAEFFRSDEMTQLYERAKEIGFSTAAAILNSADYGVPQIRKRAIVVGWRDLLPRAPIFPPSPTHSAQGSENGLPAWLTVRDAISDLLPPVGTEIRSDTAPYNLHFGRTPTSTSLARYKAVPPGGNRFDLQRNALEITPDCWIKKTSGGTDLFGRLWWDRPSVTIRTEFFKPEKGRYLHPDQHRPITHREAARLMGFPDKFIFVGSKIEIARQIGNAVPPALSRALASMVIQTLDNLYGGEEEFLRTEQVSRERRAA